MPGVLYRADGSAEIGTGHLLRGELLARACPGLAFTFVTRAHPWAVAWIEGAGHPFRTLPIEASADEEIEAVGALVGELKPAVGVVDLLDTGTDPDLCGALRDLGLPVLTFDNTGPGRLSASEVIQFLVRDPEPQALAARGVGLLEGPGYATLLPEYEGVNLIPKGIPPRARRLLVSVGGGDAAGLALKAVRALALVDRPPAATVVVGSAFPHLEELEQLAVAAPAPVTVCRALPSLLQAFRGADMAIVAGGLTMHEALATGTPALALCQEVWHQRFLAEWFQARGAMVNLGQGTTADEAQIAAAVVALAEDPDRRAALSRAGQALVDGRGTRRVAARLAALAGRRD